ncbi:MAG: hypothetical protein ABI134_15410 [Byssovorax sp.]
MSPRVQALLLLTAVFVLGAITGGAMTRSLAGRNLRGLVGGPRQLAGERAFLAALDRDVHLDPPQRAAASAIFAAQEPDAQEIRRSVAPRIAALRLRTADDVRRLLRPDQLEGFRRFMIRQEAHARILDVPPASSGTPP